MDAATFYAPARRGAKFGQLIHGSPHRGQDFEWGEDTPIPALFVGTVVDVSFRSDYGNVVVVKPDVGPWILYAHQNHTAVTVGERVTAETVIGYVGHTGTYAIGAHLHVGASVDGYDVWNYTDVDPLPFITAALAGLPSTTTASTGTPVPVLPEENHMDLLIATIDFTGAKDQSGFRRCAVNRDDKTYYVIPNETFLNADGKCFVVQGAQPASVITGFKLI